MIQKFVMLLLLLPCCVFSQTNFSIRAVVVDEQNNPVSEGEVLVFGAAESLIAISFISNGRFEVELNAGDYIFQIISDRYEILNYALTISDDHHTTLILKRQVNQLDEVIVKSGRKTFTVTNGNIMVDVANSVLNQTSNPIDLLSKLPGVQLNIDKENITVIGRGTPLIYIDNQQVNMNDLLGLSVDDIKTIEIIRNPSAKYEAHGRSVLLITRKVSKREGFEAQFSEVASFKKNFNNHLGFNSSFKRSKTEIKANLNYNQLQPWEGMRNEYAIADQGIFSTYNAVSNTKRPQLILGSGIYHQINADDYLSISISGRIQKDTDRNTTRTNFSQSAVESNIVTINNNSEDRNFYSSFANYNKRIKSLDAVIFTGIQYSNFYQKSESVIRNNFDDSQLDLAQNRNQQFKVDAFSARSDFEKTFKNELKFEAGVLYLSAKANTKFEVVDYAGGNDEESDYDFNEQNIAGYSQLSGKLAIVRYTAGLRIENTIITGRYAFAATPLIDKNFVDYFPKIQLDYAIDSTKSISINYAKSILRPNYSATSQISIYTNPYLIFSRNINLDPTITDEVSATFQYKDKSFTINLYKSKDPVLFSYSYDDNSNLTTFSSVNYKNENGLNLEAQLPFKYKWLTSTNVLNFIYNKIEDDAAVLNEPKPYLYYFSSNQLSLPKNYTLSVNGWGFTERNEGVFKRNALFVMDLALSKTLIKNIDCTISINDIFKNMTFKENFTINGIASRTAYFVDANEVSISFKYRFGSISDSNFQQRNVDENIDRVK